MVLMKVKFNIIIFLLLSANVFSQNLVPNGDFESLINLPVKPNPKNSFQYEPLSGYKPYIYNIKNWFAATKSTPDLRITDLNKHRACKKRYDDCNRAKSGIICAGIISFQKNESFSTYREYLEIKLNQKLEIGRTVNIEFWVRKEREAKLVTNNIGAYFSEKKVYAEIEDQIKVKPQFNHEDIINEKETKWIKLSGSITADKAYEHLTIGNFFSNEETKVEKFENPLINSWIPPYSYYLIDDVKVWYEGTEPTHAITKPQMPKPEKAVYTEEFIVENLLIEFEFDKDELLHASILELDQLFNKLNKSPYSYNMEVIGHTDDFGSVEHNLDLSERRARSVVRYFIKKGIDPRAIVSSGKGEGEPLVQNDTEENRRLNRRVEVRLTKVK